MVVAAPGKREGEDDIATFAIKIFNVKRHLRAVLRNDVAREASGEKIRYQSPA